MGHIRRHPHSRDTRRIRKHLRSRATPVPMPRHLHTKATLVPIRKYPCSTAIPVGMPKQPRSKTILAPILRQPPSRVIPAPLSQDIILPPMVGTIPKAVVLRAPPQHPLHNKPLGSGTRGNDDTTIETPIMTLFGHLQSLKNPKSAMQFMVVHVNRARFTMIDLRLNCALLVSTCPFVSRVIYDFHVSFSYRHDA